MDNAKSRNLLALSFALIEYPHHFIYYAIFLIAGYQPTKILFRAVLQPRDVGMLIGQSFANLEVPWASDWTPSKSWIWTWILSHSSVSKRYARELVDSYSLIWYDRQFYNLPHKLFAASLCCKHHASALVLPNKNRMMIQPRGFWRTA